MKFFRLRKLRKKGMSSSISRKTDEQRRLRNTLNSSTTIKVAIGVAVFALVVMCITMFERYYYLDVTVGFRADLDYYNSFDFRYENAELTRRMKSEAREEIPDIYRLQENKLNQDLKKMVDTANTWIEKRNDVQSEVEKELEELRKQYEDKLKAEIGLKEESISAIMELDKPVERLNAMKSLIEGDLPAARATISEWLEKRAGSKTEAELKTLREEYKKKLMDGPPGLAEEDVSAIMGLLEAPYESLEEVRPLLDADLSEVGGIISQWREKAAETQSEERDQLADIETKFGEDLQKRMPDLTQKDIPAIIRLEKPHESIGKLESLLVDYFRKVRIKRLDVELPYNLSGVAIKTTEQMRREIMQLGINAFKNRPEKEKLNLEQILSFLIYQIEQDNYTDADTETKKKLARAAEQSIKKQYTKVRKGDLIVSRDWIIAPKHVVQLRENRARSDAIKSSGEKAAYYLTVSVIALILFIIFVSYLKLYQPHILDSNARLVPFGLVIFLTLAFSRVFINFKPTHPFFDYPVLVSFAAVLMSIMFGANLAFATSLILATLVGILFDFSLPHGLLALVVGLAAAHLARNVRRRSELIRVSFIIGGVNFVLVFAISSATNMGVALTQLWQCIGGFTFGFVGAALATISLPVFEYTFKITTNISLMELTDTKNPLLRRLVMETPGTYHHSLVVGNLAEAAAESVGANALLARVAAYYHDIGKLRKPEYFSENERFSKSKHDSLIPSMSSLIITSHVKDGVDLAIKHKLNREIIDVIKQHHGTGLVYYFYKRALELVDDPDSLDDSDFRYPGPKPQFKEAAILMLADAVEAASRSLDRVSTSKLRSLVHEIITGRFNEGQFDECEVTLKDLHRIEETFLHILIGSLHQRVKYPKEGEKTMPEDSQLQEEARNDRAEEQPRFIKH